MTHIDLSHFEVPADNMIALEAFHPAVCFGLKDATQGQQEKALGAIIKEGEIGWGCLG